MVSQALYKIDEVYWKVQLSLRQDEMFGGSASSGQAAGTRYKES